MPSVFWRKYMIKKFCQCVGEKYQTKKLVLLPSYTLIHMGELLWQQLHIAQGPKDLRSLQKSPGGARRRALGRAAKLPALCQSQIQKYMASKPIPKLRVAGQTPEKSTFTFHNDGAKWVWNQAANPLSLATVLDSTPSSLSPDAPNLGLLKKRPHPQTTFDFWKGELTCERKRGSSFSQILAMNSSVIWRKKPMSLF